MEMSNGEIGIADAADLLVKAKRSPTVDHAREAIIAALFDEELIAFCRSYSITSFPSLSDTALLKADHEDVDCSIPADFWRMRHAQAFDRAPYDICVPSGSWGYWRHRNQSNFTTEIDLTGSTVAVRYPDFAELAYMGSKTVSLRWLARGVTLHEVDLRRLIEWGKPAIDRMIRRVRQAPSIRWGNLSKSDSMRVTAAICVRFLPRDMLEIVTSEEDHLLKLFQHIADDDRFQAVTSDKYLASLRDMIVEEAREFWRKRPDPAP